MPRFILLYQGDANDPSIPLAVARFGGLPDVRVIDHSVCHALLVEGPEGVISSAVCLATGWRMASDVAVVNPGSHPMVNKIRAMVSN